MNESSEARKILATIVDTAQLVVVDLGGVHGRRVWSLHTTQAAAEAMAKHLIGRHLQVNPYRSFTVMERAALPSGVLAELDQVVEAINREQRLLDMSYDELMKIDSFTIHEVIEFGVTEEAPPKQDLPVTDFEALKPHADEVKTQLTMRVAERLFANNFKPSSLDQLSQAGTRDFSNQCLSAAAVFAETFAIHFGLVPPPKE